MTKTKMVLERQTARDLSDVMRTFSRVKTIRAPITKAPTDGSGTFVAIVSTFGPPPDRQGDIVDRHAFDRTITEAYVEHPGALWPVYWNHMYEDPANVIGVITAAAATDEGLVVEGKLAIETSDRALEVYRGMLEDRVREWSISYGVVRQHVDTWSGEKVMVLDELELLEISAVTAGANIFTRTLAVKSRPKPEPETEVARLNAQLDALSKSVQPTVPEGAVDAFVAETRIIMARERAEMERANGIWSTTAIVGSVPVRVDAKLRPDR
jgi:HK97 family phage prohead protease